MKRRKAIQQIGTGLTAGLFMPAFLTSCAKEDPGPEIQYDGTVAVVGAGAAGLYAADILRAKGLNVVVFEASNQLGGRIRSLRNQREITVQSIADFPVEFGADVIYGSDSSWHKIIKTFNLPTVPLSGDQDQFVLDNVVKNKAGWQGDNDFAAAQNFVNSIATYAGSPVSVRQAASAVAGRAQGLINAQLGSRYGTSSDRLGAKPLADELKLLTRDDKSFIVATNPLQDVLLSRFSAVGTGVLLETPITSINYGGERIVLTTKSGEQREVDKVVITVPVAVMKSGGISFTPALPTTHTSALAKIGMDACIRVILDFKKNFWGADSNFIWGGTTAPQYFNTGVGRSDFYQTLSVTLHGPKAEALTGLSNNQIINAVLAELDVLYNGQGTGFVRRDLDTNEVIGFVKDWKKDGYVQGGFSYPLPSATLQDRKNIGAPVNNKLFFAGEATDILGDGGTVNGALNSAERVAEDVVKSILV